MVFSNSSTNQGIVEQTRSLMRVDSTQWPVAKIVASTNNWLDTITGYAIGADKRFQCDDTNHTKLPEGTTEITVNVSDYSFLTDEKGNIILTLIRLEKKDENGNWTVLHPIDQSEYENESLNQLQATSGPPTHYDKIADNIVRLYPKPSVTVAAGLKFSFQRTPSYFVAADTTKSPGVAPLLHRGFVIACAYDGALTLGLSNLQALAVERQMEENKMVAYFANRSNDDRNILKKKLGDYTFDEVGTFSV